MFGKRHQRSVNRMIQSVSPEFPALPTEDRLKLKKWRLETLDRRFGSKPYFEKAAPTNPDEVSPGLVSAFFMGMLEQPKFGLPQTSRMAEALDRLHETLIVAQLLPRNESLDEYKKILLASSSVPQECWLEPVGCHDFRREFERAADWQTAWKLTGFIIFHQQISLLALWDAEYCTDRFALFEPIPLFLTLAPRSRFRSSDQPEGYLWRVNSREKQMVDGPFLHLLDLLWCMIHRVHKGDWPSRVPSLAEMSKDLNAFNGDLARLRAGKPNLSQDLFFSLFPTELRDKTGSLFVPPLTLLAVAHLWDLISPPDHSPLPLGSCYLRAWHQHRRSLVASPDWISTPSLRWPAHLTQGLEYSSPSR